MKKTIKATLLERGGKEMMTLDWFHSRTVEQIKTLVAIKIKVDQTSQVFAVNGTELDDHLTRQECGIADDCRIRVFFQNDRIKLEIGYNTRKVFLHAGIFWTVNELKVRMIPVLQAAFPEDADLCQGHNAGPTGLDLLLDYKTVLEMDLKDGDRLGVFKRKEVNDCLLLLNCAVNVKNHLNIAFGYPTDARLELVGVGELKDHNM